MWKIKIEKEEKTWTEWKALRDQEIIKLKFISIAKKRVLIQVKC